jgi:hypothetical protein
MTPLSNDNDNHLMLTSHRRRSLSEGQSGISPVQEAMIEHLAYIVLAEGRPARTRDFLNFEVNGIAYSLKPGTIRNHLSHLRRLGEVEIDYKSVCTLYTLPGYSRRKSLMTSDHTSVISGRRDLAGLILRLAFGTASVHNVRLRFTVADIYDALSILSSPSTKVSSADAVAPIDTRPLQNAAALAPLSTTKRCKDGVDYDSAESIYEKVCELTGDEGKRSRLTDLKETYKRFENDKKIVGYYLLKELSPYLADRLTKIMNDIRENRRRKNQSA